MFLRDLNVSGKRLNASHEDHKKLLEMSTSDAKNVIVHATNTLKSSLGCVWLGVVVMLQLQELEKLDVWLNIFWKTR